MSHIEMKKLTHCFGRNKIIISSSVPISKELQINCAPGQSLQVLCDDKVLLETDGHSYINYRYNGEKFFYEKSSFGETKLCFMDECIVFFWLDKRSPRLRLGYNAKASSVAADYVFSEVGRKSECAIKVEIERKRESDNDFLLHLGIIAFVWMREENNRHITG